MNGNRILRATVTGQSCGQAFKWGELPSSPVGVLEHAGRAWKLAPLMKQNASRPRTNPLRTILQGVALIAMCLLAAHAHAQRDEAAGILKASGVKGGLVVHLGCGDGRLTAALRSNDRYTVHGLDADAAKVRTARGFIQSRGCYGPVSVEQWSGPMLPYADNLINLVVASDEKLAPKDE
ncbi:MAG: class I SAM-dependent methyltransferase, partial [Verrucomicrobia bacterium]|nr:class I SAM-dependent methyltransferase [Verrucomicrobiota bacterium]